MSKKKTLTLLVMLFVIVLTGYCQAGSIWAKRNKNMKDLYADDVARQIGDVLTILITEDGKVENDVSRYLHKDTNRTNTFNGQLGITTDNHNLLPRIPAFNMTASSDKTLNGESTFDDQRKITDEITVVVVDLLPNGNLVVLGKRQRDIAGDVQTIQVSGIVRRSDITFNNTVSSEQVANFHLVISNEGVSETYNKVGWLGQIFDTVWPF
ncbi:MAG: flagellar basal body L-ring protein FlgH [Planctomycetes bacterium]|nr:flagellar basal body L-ring protein FlgH [Planctomycetota bacterium]